MKEIMLMAAMMLPLEALVEELKKSLADYEANQTDKNARLKLGFNCQMIALNAGTEGREITDVMQDFMKKNRLVDAFEESKY